MVSGQERLRGLEGQLAESQLESLSSDYALLRKEYERVTSEKAVVEAVHDRLFTNTVILREAIFRLGGLIYAMSVVEATRALLVIYMGARVEAQFAKAPRSHDLDERITRIEEEITAPALAVRQIIPPEPERIFAKLAVPEALRSFDNRPVVDKLLGVRKEMKTYLERAFRS